MAAVIGWGAALTPLGLLRLPVPALARFAADGLLYAPYPALSATVFQRESPPELLSQVLAAHSRNRPGRHRTPHHPPPGTGPARSRTASAVAT
ncbi:MAG: hypothetical protein ACM3ML_10460 [Micromonosporaceae bacterium]